MKEFSFGERRLMISHSSKKNKIIIPKRVFNNRVNLIKTIKTYIKKYYNFASNKNNILYLSILYLDIILSKDKINLNHDKNLKYLCLCCFILSLKFLGDYDLSKKIIRNFCQNYKEEYNIFEMRCIQILDYNLIQTTVYDYLTIILNQDQKRLLITCNNLLNKICEDDLYLYYSPFYIAVVIIQLGKNILNDRSYNYYDKYFKDQNVIFLYKTLNQNLNIINPYINININDNNTNNKIFHEKKNYMNYYQTAVNNNNIPNINIITNNTIQNNILIINGINKENININSNDNDNNFTSKTYLRTINSNNNINPLKIIVNRYNNHKINYVKVNKNNNYNYNNTYRISRIRPNKSKNENNFRCRNSFNDAFNFKYNKSIKNNENDKTTYKNKRTINDEKIKSHVKSSTDINLNINSKPIYTNKSSLNFKLLSNVPKEVLFKLSKNISKTFGSPLGRLSVNKLENIK